MGSYGGINHIYSWFGSLFTYQFSQAFYNFKLYNDENVINYYNNSVNASLTDYIFCKSLESTYKTFKTPAWGLTACDVPKGYSGELGTPPRGFDGNSPEYIYIFRVLLHLQRLLVLCLLLLNKVMKHFYIINQIQIFAMKNMD